MNRATDREPPRTTPHPAPGCRRYPRLTCAGHLHRPRRYRGARRHARTLILGVTAVAVGAVLMLLAVAIGGWAAIVLNT